MATGEPCRRCGARPDVDCGHRPVDREWTPPKFVDRPDGRKVARGQGHSFHRGKSKHA